MKISAPVSSVEETEALIKAGAGELYCGLVPGKWREAYSGAISTNKREYERANLSNWRELKDIVRDASRFKKDVILALNNLYLQSQYPEIIQYGRRALVSGIKGLVVADLGLVSLLRKNKINIPVYISVINPSLNSEAAKLYGLLGVKRAVLERHMSLGEIRKITLKNRGIPFELFVLNAGSKNLDGYCAFAHGLEELKTKEPEDVFHSAACYFDYKIKMHKPAAGNSSFSADILQKIRSSFSPACSGRKPCAACFLPYFKKWGILALKIAGRDFPSQEKIRDVRFIRNLTDRLEEGWSSAKFSRFARRLFKDTYSFDCGGFCYYAD
ncbi:MAG: U32 family peptidase [Candidatus Omnitrophota bacterium]